MREPTECCVSAHPPSELDRTEWEDLVDRTVLPPGLEQRFDCAAVDRSEGRQSSFLTVRNANRQLVGGVRITIERRLPSRHLEMLDGPLFLPGYEDQVRALVSRAFQDAVHVVDSGFARPIAGHPWNLTAFGMHRAAVPVETIFIDLVRTEEAQLRSAEHSVRQGIRKAQDHGLKPREVTSGSDLDRAYQLIDQFGRDRDFAPISHTRLVRMHEIFHPVGKFHVLVLEAGTELAAVAVIEINNRKAGLIVAANSPAYAKVQCTSLLYWETMKFCRARGATVLDLLGLPPSGSGLDGIRRFKLKWGGTVVGGEEYLEGVLFRQLTELVRRRPDLFRSVLLQRGPFRGGVRAPPTQVIRPSS